MRRDTLLDFFDDLASRSGTFLVYDDGSRTRQWTYAEVGHAAYALASRLQAAGLSRGDRILIWAENRPEWIVAFWGALLNGVAVVPIDFRASADFLLKVRSVVDARIVLVGDDVIAPAADGFTVWHLYELAGHPAHDDAARRSHPTPSPAITNSQEAREHHLREVRAQTTKDDVAEIIFTSGATAEPKGVIIRHRNMLANIVPVEREILKYRRYVRPFQPIRFLNLLPLSHMFGQAMATFIPPMLPARSSSCGLQPAGNRARRSSAAHIGAGSRAEDAGSAARVRRRGGSRDAASADPAEDALHVALVAIPPRASASAGSSGASSSARRRSIPSSKNSGAAWATSSFKATASPRRRRSSR